MLTGIHLTINESELTAVATDSHRLSQRKATLENNATGNYDILVPGRFVKQAEQNVGRNSQEDVELQISENQVLFILDHTSFYSRLLEGQYPNTAQLILIRFDDG